MGAGDAREFILYNCLNRITFPIFDATGALVTGAGSLDSEVSKDQGAFADCTNEATEIATSSGIYYLDLIESECAANTVAVIVKSSSGKTTPMVFYPKRMTVLESGACQSATSSTLRLASGAYHSQADFYNGMWVRISSGTGVGQARRIVDYDQSTGDITIGANWTTTPSAADGYEILIPDTTKVIAWGHERLAATTSTGRPSVNTTHVSATAQTARDIGARLSTTATLTGTVQTDAGNSATQIKTNLTAAATDHYKDCLVKITSGTLAEQVKKCTGSTGTSNVTLTFTSGFTGTPADGVTFEIIND